MQYSLILVLKELVTLRGMLRVITVSLICIQCIVWVQWEVVLLTLASPSCDSGLTASRACNLVVT